MTIFGWSRTRRVVQATRIRTFSPLLKPTGFSRWLFSEICCQRLDAAQLRGVLETMARDPGANGHGFPDLLLWRGRNYRFVEVKSPTDQLSAQQLFWLRRFDALGIRCALQRVRWAD